MQKARSISGPGPCPSGLPCHLVEEKESSPRRVGWESQGHAPCPATTPLRGVKLKPRGTEALCPKLRETPTSRECQESTVSPLPRPLPCEPAREQNGL